MGCFCRFALPISCALVSLPVAATEVFPTLRQPGQVASPASHTSNWWDVHTPVPQSIGIGLQSDASAGKSAASGVYLDGEVPLAFDAVRVWGVYNPGSPPAADEFTVIVHVSPQFTNTPGSELLCQQSGIEGTRQVVGTVYGLSLWEHVLLLDRTCSFVPAQHPLSNLHVEVFNDTGPDGDWWWYPGAAQNTTFGSQAASAQANSAPGAAWTPLFGMHFSLAVGNASPRPGVVSDLSVSRLPNGQLRLDWPPDCAGASRYGVYRGDLGLGWNSVSLMPGLCSLLSNTATFSPDATPAQFFFVVPNLAGHEGSYGFDSEGQPRPRPLNACYPDGEIDACAP